MRVLPASDLINIFAALQHLRSHYEDSIEGLSAENLEELDGNDLVEEYRLGQEVCTS